MTILDIANVINVTIANVPQGLSSVNMNSVCLFTTDTPGNLDPFRTYLNSRDVGTDYGTDSETYNMATAVFAQAPNILSGGGRLVIAPLESSVSAVSGSWHTTDISANLSSLITVTDGDLKVVLNGTTINLTHLNFSSLASLSDIAAYLNTKLPDAIVIASSTVVTFTSKKVGTAASVVVGAVSGGMGTDLSGSGYFNTAGGTAVAGINSSGETIIAALARVSPLVQFVGFFTNLHVEDSVYESTATAVQALSNFWINATSSTTDIAGVCTTIGAAGDTQTKCLIYTVNLTTANLFCAAYVGRGFSVNFAGSNTFLTMNLKALATITPDPGINQTIYDAAKIAGVDTYDNFGIGAVTSNRYTADGLYFDEVYANLWLKFALQIAGFNFLASTTGRIPQTESGMNGLAAAYISILQQGLVVGVIGSGLQWNSSETFGDPEALRASIAAVGYYVYWQPIAQQSEEDRVARIAPLIQIAIKRAGAIQHSDVLAFIES